MIVTRADELPVVKDSEAARYIGKKVEVLGLVVSVTSSPLGTTFINFGRDYPDQTFAGFMAAGSTMAGDQRIDTLQGKIIGITGTIELYEGRPEIRVTSADQIKGLAKCSINAVTKGPVRKNQTRQTGLMMPEAQKKAG